MSLPLQAPQRYTIAVGVFLTNISTHATRGINERSGCNVEKSVVVAHSH